MILQEALDQVDEVNDDEVIFAAQPWTLSSAAEICRLDERHSVPASVAARGMSYFLEIFVAREVLEVFGTHRATKEQRRDLLLYYAEHDAYPEWVYRI